MSSDWNEPGATWQSTPNANWTQSPDLIPPQDVEEDDPLHAQHETYAYASEAQDIDDPSFSPEADVFPDDQEVDGGEESDIEMGLDPTATSDSLLKQVWRYVTLIVFPLLFFGLACLFILPFVAISHPSPIAFWFIVTVLMLIAVGQGVAVYLGGPHHHMWVLGTSAGLILFVLFGVFAVIGPIPGTVLLLVILGGCIYLARRCIHPVAEGLVDIVYVSGKYSRTLFPGFNLIWPWDVVSHQVNIEETNWNCPPQKIQLSPEEDVILRAVISYQVVPEDAHLAVTQVDNWQESLRNLFVTTLQTVATHFTPTDFLAWPQSLQVYQAQNTSRDPQSTHLPDEVIDDFSAGPSRREHINTLLFQQMRDRVAMWGIQIHWVRIRDIELVPHTLADIGAPPLVLDYTANGNQTEEELFASSNRAQFANGQDSVIGGTTGHISVDQEPTEALVAANAAPNLPSPPQKLPSEEVLRKAYEQVQSGKVTDPQTIRRLAVTFEAVARDSEMGQKISFDAERASDNLYKQAQHYEAIYQSGEGYTDIAQPD